MMTQNDLTEPWRSNRVRWRFIGLFCVFFISNVLLAIRVDDRRVPNLVEASLLGLALGMVGAQAALHSIWTVFGTQNDLRCGRRIGSQPADYSHGFAGHTSFPE